MRPKAFFDRYALPLAVFCTGACVLIVEIVATRILSPYFGNTIYSVSSVISVVLAALSLGYYFGGRLADKYPLAKLFYAIIAFSGVAVVCIQLLQASLLPVLGYELPLSFGPLVTSCVLFFLPSFILGTLSPFAIALQQKQAQKGQGVGTTSGIIFFFSTLGSIFGSLLAGFVLIPRFGITSILVGVGIFLLVLGLVPLVLLKIEERLALVLVLLMTAVLLLSSMGAPNVQALYNRDGIYEKIRIFDGMHNGRPARFLLQDASSSAAMYLDGEDAVFGYTDYFRLHELFTPKVERALVIGGGGYTVPKGLLQTLPAVQIDVSEIEPSLVPLAKQYFKLPDDPRLTHHIKDGRRMLHDTPHRYDLIFGDAYHSMFSVPSHLTTIEAMQLVHDRLAPQGVFIANLIGSPSASGPSFVWSEIRTMQTVFPQVYVFAVISPTESMVQNIIAVGSKRSQRIDINQLDLQNNNQKVIRELAAHAIDLSRVPLDNQLVLTDDYAPVDFLVSGVLPKR